MASVDNVNGKIHIKLSESEADSFNDMLSDLVADHEFYEIEDDDADLLTSIKDALEVAIQEG